MRLQTCFLLTRFIASNEILIEFIRVYVYKYLCCIFFSSLLFNISLRGSLVEKKTSCKHSWNCANETEIVTYTLLCRCVRTYHRVFKHWSFAHLFKLLLDLQNNDVSTCLSCRSLFILILKKVMLQNKMDAQLAKKTIEV